MVHRRVRVLFVTDLTYQARGRRYGDEDVLLSARLRDWFDVALCHPLDAAELMDSFDVVAVRNSGPVLHYRDAYDAFRRQVLASGVRVFTELTGKADAVGKRYLLDLYRAGYPVIPTADNHADALALPRSRQYVAKPLFGADSVGLRFLTHTELDDLAYDDVLVQPRVDFVHEVSFYFVDHALVYALYAPDPDQRWALEPYAPTAADRAFAHRFVVWNDIDHGIQRVDACRTTEGRLLLVELEDLNPYLSLDLLDDRTRDEAITAIATSIAALAEGPPPRDR